MVHATEKRKAIEDIIYWNINVLYENSATNSYYSEINLMRTFFLSAAVSGYDNLLRNLILQAVEAESFTDFFMSPSAVAFTIKASLQRTIMDWVGLENPTYKILELFYDDCQSAVIDSVISYPDINVCLLSSMSRVRSVAKNISYYKSKLDKEKENG